MNLTRILPHQLRFLAALLTTVATLVTLHITGDVLAAGLPTQSWPAGTFLKQLDVGGRICTYHRGYLYMSGARSRVFDISNIANPVERWSAPGDNGHRWHKVGDLFWREYRIPETTESIFLDLSTMPNPIPWKRSSPAIAAWDPADGRSLASDIQTWPYRYAGWEPGIYDCRTATRISTANLESLRGPGVTAGAQLNIGNLFFWTPLDLASGVACIDLTDPANPRRLSSISGSFFQYPTAVHVWKHYIISLIGNNNNNGGNNMVAIDFSDPNNLRYAWGVPVETMPGRYAFYQDNFMFTASFNKIYKYNMETRSMARVFEKPAGWKDWGDFQPIPLGHILMASWAETGVEGTTFIAHQDGFDTTPPSVSWHWPLPNSVNRGVRTCIGLVINETLDDTTINDQTIRVRPVGGALVAGDASSTSYNVINFMPRTPFAANTTYEVRVEGIKDVAGNLITPYTFYFSTGSSLDSQQNRAPAISSFTSSPASPITRGQSVTFSASASDPDGDPLQFRWDYGDGGGASTWGGASSITRAFSSAGTYTIQVQVQDNKGAQISRTLTLVVNDPAPAAQPTRSSPIALAAAARKVWVVNPDNDSVSALHADTFTRLHEVSVGLNPTSVAVDSLGQVWVTCRGDDTVRILNGATAASIATLTLSRGSQPINIVFTPNGSTGYVAEHGNGRIARVDAATRSVTASVFVGPSPRGLAIPADASKLFVTRFISAGASAGSIYTVNLASLSSGPTINLAADTTSADSSVLGRGLPNYLLSIALSPSSGRGYVTAKKDNIFRGVARDGNNQTFETTLRALLASFNSTANSDEPAQRIDIDNAELPSAAAFSPAGGHLFVALQGNNKVNAINAATRGPIASTDVGRAPQGLVLDPATKRLFVQNFMSRNVTVLNAQPMLDTGASTLPVLATVPTITTEKLPAQVLLGKQIFYNAADTRMTQDGYLSCAACHLDGDSDGRVWDFTQRGEGLRKTLPLRGRRGTGLGPVHWTANFNEIQDFENDIRAAFGGAGFLTDSQFNTGSRSDPLGDPKTGLSAELDALAAYVSSLNTVHRSPHRTSSGALTAEAAAGKTLFNQLNCNTCHGGSDFTDRAFGHLHNVGTIKPASGKRRGQTLTGFATPTLKGIWETAPYLHDGSAGTLNDIFTNASGSHSIATLTPAQFNQLMDYLRQIDDSESAGALPLVTIIASDPLASESGPSAGQFTISRTPPLSAALTVGLTVSGTATSADYQPLPSSVTIPANQSSVTFSLIPTADSITDPNETVVVTLPAHATYIRSARASAAVTVLEGPEDNQAPSGGVARTIPGTIQAEDFDTGGQGVAYSDLESLNQGGQYRPAEAVDIEACSDTGGGFNIGWTRSGEWIEYTVDVPASGLYTLNLRVARAPTGSQTLRILFNGADTSGPLTVPSTGGWQTWTTVTKTGIPLSAGRQVMRLEFVGADFNLNWIQFVTESTSSTTSGSTTANSTTSGSTTGAPNLVVDDVTWSPNAPRPGDAVTFSAILRNTGPIATPAGTVVGVGFLVNGISVGWGIDDASGLAAGATRTIVGNGAGAWTAIIGAHSVEAIVDDINRIAESNENDNRRSESLTISADSGTGSITREVWTGVGGNAISDIPTTALPNLVDTLTQLETPSNWADNFATRIRGYLHAPASGSYTFWIASDDSSELWLSTHDQPASRIRIARVDGWTTPREWTREANQKSAAIALTAGQRYYIEVLHKEGGGGDNLAVGWSRPGQSTAAPAEIIPGTVLAPYAVPGAGLSASYYNTGSTTPSLTRLDGPINFNWGTGSPGAGINVDNFSVRWTGQLQATVAGSYRLITESDDGIRVTLNGQLIVDNWTDHAPTLNESAPIPLSAGQKLPITVDYYERGGGAVARLLWLPPGATSPVPVPQENLYAQ